MKLKTKILIVTMLALFAVLIGATNVNATEVTDEELLNAIPEEIVIDIPEIDYAKAENSIKGKIKEILKENELNVDDEDFNVGYFNILGGMDYFYKATIYGKDTNNKKEIKIKYNNTDKHTASDEQAINNLQIKDPKYGTYTPEDFFATVDDVRFRRKSLE